jgi:hypothetical protein
MDCDFVAIGNWIKQNGLNGNFSLDNGIEINL